MEYYWKAYGCQKKNTGSKNMNHGLNMIKKREYEKERGCGSSIRIYSLFQTFREERLESAFA